MIDVALMRKTMLQLFMSLTKLTGFASGDCNADDLSLPLKNGKSQKQCIVAIISPNVLGLNVRRMYL